MPYRQKIVCLASSVKPGGRCVAGKLVAENGHSAWIRPVSARASAEISLEERQYEDGTEPEILDIIGIRMIGPVPRLHQTENHMIDAEYYWTKEGVVGWEELDDLVDEPATLWRNGDSTRAGINDRMSQATAAQFQNSLYLIEPQNVTIEVLTPGADFGNPRRVVRAGFTYNGAHYNLTVTDPDARKAFLARPNGDYRIAQKVYFCVSLAEAHTDGYCYKLVATIIAQHPL